MCGNAGDILRSMDGLLDDCDHILESEIPDEAIEGMREAVHDMQKQSEEYRKKLLDQEIHSRSAESRDMAAVILEEENRIREILNKDLWNSMSAEYREERDFNIDALYIEYLTGRARQAVREALTGAMHLKLLSMKLQND